MAEDYSFVKRQREVIYNAVQKAIKLDPELRQCIVREVVVVVDVLSRSEPDDESLREEFRGQDVSTLYIFSSDATAQTDLPVHKAAGLLMYAGHNLDDIIDVRDDDHYEKNDSEDD